MDKRAAHEGSSRRLSGRGLAKALGWAAVVLVLVAPSILHTKAGIGISPILTGSMRPSADPGDAFVTQLTPASQLRVGDIISVHSESTGVFYAHRIAEIRVQSGLLRITTKGDANGSAEADPFLVGAGQEVSKEIATVKWLGQPLTYLTSIQGRQAGLALLVFANLIGLLLFLFRRKASVAAALPSPAHDVELASAHAQVKAQHEELEHHRRFAALHAREQEVADFLQEMHLHRNTQPQPIRETT